MKRTVALIGALDTKGDDIAFLRAAIERHGHAVLLIDTSVLADPTILAEIPSARVAQAGGGDLSALRESRDRGSAIAVMENGARAIVASLAADGTIDGVMGLGGGAGTTVSASAMRELPIGFPKVLVTTLASGDTHPYVGTSDILLFPSIVDVAGLNRISRLIYTRAADALCGMLEGVVGSPDPAEHGDRPLIAATMFGVTTPSVTRARERLEAAGCEVLVFHAVGVGGDAMERLVGQGLIDGVLDITTTELADMLVGGIYASGDERLRTAGARGVPQLVSMGALDMVNFGNRESVPARFRGRQLYSHNAENTLMRTTVDESRTLGRMLAERLNGARGPVMVVIPLLGFSALDREGQPFDDPEARVALIDAFTAAVDRSVVDVREVDRHVNDEGFSDEVADLLLELMGRTAAVAPTGAERKES